jgi:hypothetical protein
MEDGGRLVPMMAALVDSMTILMAVRRFPSIGAADSRSLQFHNYFRIQHFNRRSIVFPYGRRPPSAQRRRPRSGVRSQARRHSPPPPRGERC